MPAGMAQYDTTGTYDFDWADFEVASDICVVAPIKEEVTKGGIVIADVGDAQSVRWGKIVAHGPGRMYETGTYETIRYAVGDLVMYGKAQSGGEPIIIGGKSLLMFRQNDFVGKLKAKPGLKVVA